MIFDIENRPPHYTNSQKSIISFGYVDFYAKIFPILYPLLENSTTRTTILNTSVATAFCKKKYSWRQNFCASFVISIGKILVKVAAKPN